MIESLTRLQIVIRTIGAADMCTQQDRYFHKVHRPCKWKSCLSLLSDASLKGELKKRRSLWEES